jgi:hypothetical protein
MTAAYGFVESPLDRLVDPFCELVARWTGATAARIQRKPSAGSIDRALSALLPRRDSMTEPKYLLAPCANGWTAYFENSRVGDPRPPSWELPDVLSCRAVLVYAEGSSSRPTRPRTYGFSLRAPGLAGPVNSVRTLMRNAGEKRLQRHGTRLPGEGEDDEDGFDFERLDRYLQSLGIRAFDPEFFMSPTTVGIELDTRGARAIASQAG